MAFPGLPETFALIVHHLRTNNVNVFVSKIYPSGLIFGRGGVEVYIGVYTGVLIFAMLIGFHIWSGRIFEGFIYGGVLTRFYGIWKNVLIYFILTVLFNLTTIQQKRLKVKLIGHRSKRKIKNNLMNLEFIIWKVLRHSQTTQIKK